MPHRWRGLDQDYSLKFLPTTLSRMAPDWNLRRTLYQLSYSAADKYLNEQEIKAGNFYLSRRGQCASEHPDPCCREHPGCLGVRHLVEVHLGVHLL